MNVSLTELSLITFLFSVTLCAILAKKLLKKAETKDKITNSLLMALFEASYVNPYLLVWVKDRNCRYVACSDNVKSILYPEYQGDIVGKSDLEIATGKKLVMVFEDKIKTRQTDDPKVVVYEYDGLAPEEFEYLCTDLVVIKEKKKVRFFERWDGKLLDVYKFPIIIDDRVEYVVSLGVVLQEFLTDDCVNDFFNCLTNGTYIYVLDKCKAAVVDIDFKLPKDCLSFRLMEDFCK